MNHFLIYISFIIFSFKSNVLSHDDLSAPSTWDFRRFAAWDFKDVITDSCNFNNEQANDNEFSGKTKQYARNTTRFGKAEDPMTTLEQYLLSNVSSGISKDSSEDETEGLHELNLLPNAPSSGAVCLDGSPPGFYLRNGTGLGKSKWIIFFEGGAWCNDPDTCYQRSNTELGSSKCYRRYLRLEGLLSNQARYNPEFYNWTSVFVRYCDGASFTGDRANPLKVKNKELYFRGQRILDSVLDELIRRGIDRASEIILSGRSAGALAAVIHADYIQARFRRATNASFRVLSDAGFFVDAPSLNGSTIIQSAFRQIYSLHNSSTGLNQACLRAQKRGQEWRCFFPQYSIPFVTSQVFLVNALYDLWQIAYLSNIPCVLHLKTCNSTEFSHIMKFREKTLHALSSVRDSNVTGVFADSCFVHTQSVMNDLWTRIRVNDVTMAQAFVNWYRGDLQDRFRIDRPYPSNLSCPKDYHI